MEATWYFTQVNWIILPYWFLSHRLSAALYKENPSSSSFSWFIHKVLQGWAGPCSPPHLSCLLHPPHSLDSSHIGLVLNSWKMPISSPALPSAQAALFAWNAPLPAISVFLLCHFVDSSLNITLPVRAFPVILSAKAHHHLVFYFLTLHFAVICLLILCFCFCFALSFIIQ